MRQRQRPPVWSAWAAAAWFAWVAADEWPLPSVYTLTPGGGPVAGGTLLTLSGAGFTRGDARLCRFGRGTGGQAVEVAASFSGKTSTGLLFCAAPPADEGYTVAVEVSLDDGGTYTASGHSFAYYHEAVVSSASPSSGPASGGTRVTLHGYNIAATAPATLSCRFGHRDVPATYVDSRHVACAAPSHTADGSLTLDFGGLAPLTPAMDPAAAPDGVRGGAALSGDAAVIEGVLWLGGDPPAPPASAAQIGGGVAVEPGRPAGSGCGVLALGVELGTHAAPRGFDASFELLMAGDGARGVALTYGPPGAQPWVPGYAGRPATLGVPVSYLVSSGFFFLPMLYFVSKIQSLFSLYARTLI